MCNISDKRDNMRVFKNSYFPGMQFKGSSNINLKKGNVQNDYMERNKITNSFLKKSADNTVEKKVTSVVKSSKVGGATDNEETAHFVFFDMED